MKSYFFLLIFLLGCFCPLPSLILAIVVWVASVGAAPPKMSLINLQTKQTNCVCGGKLTSKHRSTNVTIYTRYGTQQGLHHEYRFVYKVNLIFIPNIHFQGVLERIAREDSSLDTPPSSMTSFQLVSSTGTKMTVWRTNIWS
jgi:hypothetical protein